MYENFRIIRNSAPLILSPFFPTDGHPLGSPPGRAPPYPRFEAICSHPYCPRPHLTRATRHGLGSPPPLHFGHSPTTAIDWSYFLATLCVTKEYIRNVSWIRLLGRRSHYGNSVFKLILCLSHKIFLSKNDQQHKFHFRS